MRVKPASFLDWIRKLLGLEYTERFEFEPGDSILPPLTQEEVDELSKDF